MVHRVVPSDHWQVAERVNPSATAHVVLQLELPPPGESFVWVVLERCVKGVVYHVLAVGVVERKCGSSERRFASQELEEPRYPPIRWPWAASRDSQSCRSTLRHCCSQAKQGHRWICDWGAGIVAATGTTMERRPLCCLQKCRRNRCSKRSCGSFVAVVVIWVSGPHRQ